MIPRYLYCPLPVIAENIPGAELYPRTPPLLPIAHSAQHIGSPISKNESTYAIMNAPPPYSATRPGNLKKLPKPTALPETAKITPIFEFHFSEEFFSIIIKNNLNILAYTKKNLTINNTFIDDYI